MSLTRTLISITSTTVLVLAALFLFTTPASAATCNIYNASTGAPSGYGASYNVFKTSELMISIACNEDKSIKVTAGNNDPLTYIYKDGYYYNPSAKSWTNFTYSCDNMIVNSWCVGQVNKTLTDVPTDAHNFLVSFTCQWSGNKWNCGCSNTSCSTAKWQIQGWKVAPPQSGGGGPDIPAGAKILWQQDFEGISAVSSPRPITAAEGDKLFVSAGSIRSLGEKEARLSPDPVKSGRGNVLEVHHSKDDCGHGFRTTIKRNLNLKEVWYSFDAYLPSNYIAQYGSKFGIRVQRNQSSSESPYYTSTVGLGKRENDPYNPQLESYAYLENTKGKEWHWNTGMPRNQWATIKVYSKVNTFTGNTANANGVIRVWLNEKEVFSKSSIRFSVNDNPAKFDQLLFVDYYGGPCNNPNDKRWWSPQNQSRYYDNLVFWTQ